MTNEQSEALRFAEMCDAVSLAVGGPSSNIAALLRTQHAAIERKDALLRQAWEAINNAVPPITDVDEARLDAAFKAITKELSQ